MEDSLSQLAAQLKQAAATLADWGTSPTFYAQLGMIVVAVTAAAIFAAIFRARISLLPEQRSENQLFQLRSIGQRLKPLLFAILNIMFLGIAVGIADQSIEQSWLIRGGQGLAAVFLLYWITREFVKNAVVKVVFIWLGMPIVTLSIFGWLDDVTLYLDSVSLSAGNIRISLLALLRTLIFGSLLFWLGRLSNSAGKQAIRNRTSLDVGTREVFAKLFELALFAVIFLLFLQVLGINLTALAVFGGALGVGLGFGLQQIAANFISGIIILLDRSITIGDHIELEDGRAGVLRELSMRQGIIETFDGKDIMVPNEQFITTSYTNWTHKNPEQRYAINFQVAYSTDLDLLFDNIRAICNAHPTVISGDDLPIELKPDAEIAGFGDSGIDILVEFWMNGIDDGKNRVAADLMYSIWQSIKENNMEIPFPQREVRILNESLLNK